MGLPSGPVCAAHAPGRGVRTHGRPGQRRQPASAAFPPTKKSSWSNRVSHTDLVTQCCGGVWQWLDRDRVPRRRPVARQRL